MRFLFKVSLVIAFFLLLTGCYDSEVPMAPVKDAVFDAKTMEKRNWSVSTDVYLCRAYTIMVDGVAFCNVQYISSNKKDKRPFMSFRYSFSKDGILTWRWISNDLIKTKIKTSKELYGFIKKNMNNEKLYGKPLKFKKLI